MQMSGSEVERKVLFVTVLDWECRPLFYEAKYRKNQQQVPFKLRQHCGHHVRGVKAGESRVPAGWCILSAAIDIDQKRVVVSIEPLRVNIIALLSLCCHLFNPTAEMNNIHRYPVVGGIKDGRSVSEFISSVVTSIKGLPDSIENTNNSKGKICSIANQILVNGDAIIGIINPAYFGVHDSLLFDLVQHNEILPRHQYPNLHDYAMDLLPTLTRLSRQQFPEMDTLRLYRAIYNITSIVCSAAVGCGAVLNGSRLVIPPANVVHSNPIFEQAYLGRQSDTQFEISASMLMGLKNDGGEQTSYGRDQSSQSQSHATSQVAGGHSECDTAEDSVEDNEGRCLDAWFRTSYAMELTNAYETNNKNALHACFYGLDKLYSIDIPRKELNACRAKKHRKKKVMEEQIVKMNARMDGAPLPRCSVWVGDTAHGDFIDVEPQTCSGLVREMGSPGSSGSFFEGFIMKSWAGLDAIENSRRQVAVSCKVEGRQGVHTRLTGCVSNKVLVGLPCGKQREWFEKIHVSDLMEMLTDG